MRIVNVYEAKSILSKLLDAVERGEEIVITRAGKPVADLTPHQARRRPVVVGGLADQIDLDEEDFEHLDADIAAMFYGDGANQ